MGDCRIFVGPYELIIHMIPEMTVRVFKAEEGVDLGRIPGRAVIVEYIDGSLSAAIAQVETGIHRDERAAAVVAIPRTPVFLCHARTKTTLIESVCISLCVDCRLCVVGAEDNPEERSGHGEVAHRGTEPPRAVLSGRSSPVLCVLVAGWLAEERTVGVVEGGIVIATSVVCACIKEANQTTCAAL